MCFVAFMLCNMDRVNMSIAVLPMAETFAWSSTTIGLVQSSFFWGRVAQQLTPAPPRPPPPPPPSRTRARHVWP